MQTNRSNAGTLIAGAILILFGLLALARNVFDFIDWGSLWPVTIIAFGGLFFFAMIAGGKQAAGFAVPGSIISGIGLVLLFQSITDRWESMSYFWTLIILFVGVGIYIMGLYGGDENQKRSGLGVMKVAFVLFIIFGAFFELIFSSFDNLLFPILLILLGGYLVLSRSGLFGTKKVEESTKDPLPPVPPAS